MGMLPVQPLSLSFLADPAVTTVSAPAPLTIQPLTLPGALADSMIFGSDLLSIGSYSEPQPAPVTKNVGERFFDFIKRKAASIFGSSNTRGFWTNPVGFFISQYKGDFNTKEDVAGNGNCGPTSLSMAAAAFGRVTANPESADSTIERTRRLMGAGGNEHAGTSLGQIKKGAEAYGLSAYQTGGSLDKLQAELDKGRLPIVLVAPKYFRNSKSNGHYVVVTKIDSQGVHCNDPAIRKGPIVIPVDGFMRGWTARGAGAVSIGA